MGHRYADFYGWKGNPMKRFVRVIVAITLWFVSGTLNSLFRTLPPSVIWVLGGLMVIGLCLIEISQRRQRAARRAALALLPEEERLRASLAELVTTFRRS
jgi:hypothetical protein